MPFRPEQAIVAGVVPYLGSVLYYQLLAEHRQCNALLHLVVRVRGMAWFSHYLFKDRSMGSLSFEMSDARSS